MVSEVHERHIQEQAYALYVRMVSLGFRFQGVHLAWEEALLMAKSLPSPTPQFYPYSF